MVDPVIQNVERMDLCDVLRVTQKPDGNVINVLQNVEAIPAVGASKSCHDHEVEWDRVPCDANILKIHSTAFGKVYEQ